MTLAPAHRLPGDREWAVLTEAGERHAGPGAPDRWLPKSCFVRGVVAPALQAVRGGLEGDRLTFSHPDRPPLAINPTSDGDQLLEWLAPLWPAGQPRPTRLVRGAGIWTDADLPWLSILSLSSLAQLEADAGKPLGIDRWRGNLWVAGWEPFAETRMIGSIVRIGGVELRITEPIGRCAATSADGDTGLIDLDMPQLLTQTYGDSNFGVYAEVLTGGHISVGDPVTT